MRHFLFSLLLFLTVTPLWSQKMATVKGIVYDDLGNIMSDVNILITSTKTGTVSGKDGSFEIQIPANEKITVVFSYTAYESKTMVFELKDKETKTVNITLKIRAFDAFVKIDKFFRPPPPEILPRIETKLVPTSSGNFEDIIKTIGLGVSSNNEMTANYSVRGGNYDENLIYVNDIPIYRPFLARSGQQEGLSFINGDLVDGIYFSSGGFEARFGDKLSSVLDIKYKEPIEKKASASASLLGGSVHFEGKIKNFTYLTGIRYRSNSYVLNSLPTKGDYKPVFGDGQFLFGYMINERWNISLLGHYSNNLFRVVPENRETEFGTVNEALRLTIYFDGQEITQFETMTFGFTSEHKIKKNTNLKFILSSFSSTESEKYDILGQYRLDELEKDLGSENFGEVAFTRGVGSFLNHARNELKANVYTFNAIGISESKNKKHHFHYGVGTQYETIQDRLSEWDMLDSMGFSIPQFPANAIELNNVIRTKLELNSYRIYGHFQDSWSKFNSDTIHLGDSTFVSTSIWELNYGIRSNYWSYNGQNVISPRANISYTPSWFRLKKGIIKRINIVFRFRTGIYYQPPFYRELRDLNARLHPEVLAQRSIHFVAGSDLYFNMWDRTFKLTTEMYYKHLDFMNTYEIDNVRIRYYANNDAKGYAAGWDFRLNGEFIKGIESWATMSFLRTYENISNDYYTEYYNSDGNKIIPGYTFNNTVVDSATFYPGSIPRPTDQFFRFGLFFQDEMPRFPSFKVHLNLLFGTPLPYGPPDFNRYKDTLRTSPYRRVDIGFSKQFLTRKDKIKPGSIWSKMADMWLSLEIFNLLDINNTISYQWVEDISGRTYAVPNYLTSRRVNLKLLIKF